jgi:uncharacterized protein
MRALFDVNVLIALFQPDHVHHARVHDWWATNQHHGWASCPLTENGFVRILSQPKYPMPQTVAGATRLLHTAMQETDHAFWPDSLSLTDAKEFAIEALSNHAQVTDSYLVALAVYNSGRLISLDQDITTTTVRNFTKGNLCLL